MEVAKEDDAPGEVAPGEEALTGGGDAGASGGGGGGGTGELRWPRYTRRVSGGERTWRVGRDAATGRGGGGRHGGGERETRQRV